MCISEKYCIYFYYVFVYNSVLPIFPIQIDYLKPLTVAHTSHFQKKNLLIVLAWVFLKVVDKVVCAHSPLKDKREGTEI